MITSTFLSHLALAVHDVQLRHDRQRLEPDREAQQVLVVAVVVGAGQVEHRRYDAHQRVDEEVVVQGVGLRVVAQAEGLLHADQVYDVRRRGNEQQLEERVVQRNVVQEEVGVAGAEDDQVDLLGAVGQFCLAHLARSCFCGSG